MTIGFDELMQILQLAAIVLAFFWMNRSFPPGPTAELIERLSKTSEKTETKVDDVLVDIVKMLNDMRKPEVAVVLEPEVVEVTEETEIKV